ncbi:MAG TPA: M48 family metallopeptidase, partial [Cellvibrionaceae bacterium]
PGGGELLLRVFILAIAVGVLLWLLFISLTTIVHWIPIHYEQRLVGNWQTDEPDSQNIYLQKLSENLARAGGLDPALITIHVQANETVNAFATLGGNIVVFEGLLDALDSEQALAFVLAHEVAHIALRHPIEGLARHMGFSLTLALVFGHSDVASIAGAGGNLALLTYSRDFERAADVWAYRALINHYGHINGSDNLFHTLAEQPGNNIPAWLATHPDIGERLTLRERWSTDNDWPLNGPLTPLPNWQPTEPAASTH